MEIILFFNLKLIITIYIIRKNSDLWPLSCGPWRPEVLLSGSGCRRACRGGHEKLSAASCRWDSASPPSLCFCEHVCRQRETVTDCLSWNRFLRHRYKCVICQSQTFWSVARQFRLLKQNTGAFCEKALCFDPGLLYCKATGSTHWDSIQLLFMFLLQHKKVFISQMKHCLFFPISVWRRTVWVDCLWRRRK